MNIVVVCFVIVVHGENCRSFFAKEPLSVELLKEPVSVELLSSTLTSRISDTSRKHAAGCGAFDSSFNTGWRRLTRCFKLQVIFRKRALQLVALLRISDTSRKHTAGCGAFDSSFNTGW